MAMTNITKRRIIIFTSLVAYATCLPLDSVCTSEGCFDFPAYAILLFGIFGMFGSIANFLWIANPLYFAALFYFYKNRNITAIKYSVLSSICALLLLFFNYMLIDESGRLGKITSFQSGYWVWVFSLIGTSFMMIVYEFETRGKQ